MIEEELAQANEDVRSRDRESTVEQVALLVVLYLCLLVLFLFLLEGR